MSSQLTAFQNVESAGHMLKCRVSWLRAKNDESAGHVIIKCRVSWPRAKRVVILYISKMFY